MFLKALSCSPSRAEDTCASHIMKDQLCNSTDGDDTIWWFIGLKFYRHYVISYLIAFNFSISLDLIISLQGRNFF